MTLDKFINNVRTKVAEKYNLKTDAEIDAFFLGMEESAKDNQEILEKRDKMLRDTVEELCEAKRLLKVAVEDIGGTDNCCLCKYQHNPDYICQTVEDCFTWRYMDEVLKLMGYGISY